MWEACGFQTGLMAPGRDLKHRMLDTGDGRKRAP